jgi:DUF917 family protein
MKTFNKVQLENIAWGACLLGSGGGGALYNANQMLHALPKNWKVNVATVQEAVKAGGLAAVVAYIGAPSAVSDLANPIAAERAFIELNNLCKKQFGGPIKYLVPVEIGPISSLVSCIVASKEKISVIDADGAGRAVPALTLLTFSSLSPDPLVLANHTNIDAILKTPQVSMAEELTLSVISASNFGSIAGLAMWPMQPPELNKVLPEQLRGSLTLCHDLGSTLRNDPKPVPAARLLLKQHGYRNWLLGKCKITNVSSAITGGLDLGQVDMQGEGGVQLTVFNTNENLILWSSLKDRPLTIAPDLICYVTEQGKPYSNADLLRQRPVEDICLLLAEARPVLRQKPILPSFQKYLVANGYAGAYVPIEKLKP